MKPPRGLSADEAALWQQVIATVTPLAPAGPDGSRRAEGQAVEKDSHGAPATPPPPPMTARKVRGRVAPPRVQPATGPKRPSDPGLDSHWERRLGRASTDPDLTLDLHGHTLDQAHRRLDAGLMQAKAMGARLVLVITGKPRPVDAADRATRRGAIRAKILDWLAAGPHGADIAAVRAAHRRHGGEGALYLVLKRRR